MKSPLLGLLPPAMDLSISILPPFAIRFPADVVNGCLDSLFDRDDLLARNYFFHADDRTVRRTENSGAFRGDFSGGIAKKPEMSPTEIGDTAKCQKSELQHAEQTHCCFVYLQTSLRPTGHAWWRMYFIRALLSLQFINAKPFYF
jgi:hypothetical protein